MAEYKRYITQIQENGNVMISEDVVCTIVGHAALEVEGVDALVAKKSWGKSIKILIGEDNALTIDCNISVKFGNAVVSVAKNVQEHVTNSVESMTGVKVAAMNVNVCGIGRQ